MLPATLNVNTAKSQFTELVRGSSEAFKVYRVKNGLRRNAPGSLILGEDALRMLLAQFQIHPQWEEDGEQGLWTVYAPELDVYGQGSTREEAAADLMEAAQEYAELYLEDPQFNFKVGRKDHFPFVILVALAAGNPDQVRAALGL